MLHLSNKPGCQSVRVKDALSLNSTRPTRTSLLTSAREEVGVSAHVEKLVWCAAACAEVSLRRHAWPVQLATSRTRTTILADLSPDFCPTRALFLARMSVGDLYTCTCNVHDKLSCTRLQNYMMDASLMSVSVSVSVAWGSSFTAQTSGQQKQASAAHYFTRISRLRCCLIVYLFLWVEFHVHLLCGPLLKSKHFGKMTDSVKMLSGSWVGWPKKQCIRSEFRFSMGKERFWGFLVSVG